MRDMVLDKKTNKYYDIYLSKQELGERKQRAFRVLYHKELEYIEEQNRLKQNGICPKCFCYRPNSGLCDCEL